ncbi:hypothetical protein [Streptomyces sp. NPDC040750]|uniref:hypothetical protein n=1 Tax=Streptomyces sp. NPDC040750 TaxID=3154491 RepID=UPI0033D48F3C
MYLDRARVHADVAALHRLSELLLEIPDRMFGGSLDATLAFHGLNPILAGYVKEAWKPVTPLHLRPDCLLRDGTLTLVEFNVGSGSTTVSGGVLTRMFYETSKAFRAHTAELEKLGGVETYRADEVLVQHLESLRQADEPVVIWVLDDEPLHVDLARALVALCDSHGLDVRLALTEEILAAEPADLPNVFSYFSSLQFELPDRESLHAGYRKLLASPHRAFYDMDLMSLYYTSKANLALLRAPEFLAGLAPEDAALVERHIPETVVIRDEADIARLTGEQSEWVIKPFRSFQARGTLAGRWTPADEWRAALVEAAAEGGFVAQRFIEDDRVLQLVATDQGAEWRRTIAIVSPHIIGGRFGGMSFKSTLQDALISNVDYSSTFFNIGVLVGPEPV